MPSDGASNGPRAGGVIHTKNRLRA
jgi:hypothetical protein